MPVEDQIYEPHFQKKFRPKVPTDFRREFNLTIYAVGTTVERALKALAKTNEWGKLDKIVFQEVDTPCDWYVYFTADGTGMKASGEYVTGGVIVTWWK
jgi:hypothetical protein